MEIHYERLVEDPEREMKRVCEFLNLQFDEHMLNPGRSVRRQMESGTFGGEDKSLLLPITPNLRDWRSQMDPLDLAIFRGSAESTLREFGYSPTPPQPAPVRREAGAIVARYRIRSLPQRARQHVADVIR
jgi:hypothetical protein